MTPDGQADRVGFTDTQSILLINDTDVRGFTLEQVQSIIAANSTFEIQVNGPVIAREVLETIISTPENTGTLDRAGGASMGLTILSAPRRDAGLPITAVDNGGQADYAGFNAGMNVLTINGTDARGFTLEEAATHMKLSTSVVLQVDARVVSRRPPTPEPVKVEADVTKVIESGILSSRVGAWRRASVRASSTNTSEARVPQNSAILDRSDGKSVGLVILDAPSPGIDHSIVTCLVCACIV